MIKQLALYFSLIILLANPQPSFAQDKAPALSDADLKTALQTIEELDWYPKVSRDALTETQNALVLSDQAKKLDNMSLAYATIIEAVKRSDSVQEWHLSRDLLREADSTFKLPPDMLKTWYLDAIKKTKTGARLAELVNLLMSDVSATDLPGQPKDWQTIHRLLARRLDTPKLSSTQFQTSGQLQRIKNRIDLHSKLAEEQWQGVAMIVQKNEIQPGLEKLAGAKVPAIADAASAASNSNFSYPAYKELFEALVATGDGITREAAIAIFNSIIEKLTNDQIIELQDVCYALDHELADDLSLPFYAPQQNGGQMSRMRVKKIVSGSRNITFNEADNSISVDGDCWVDYVQMPLTNSVHDIEFSAEDIPSFFKFRYGDHNSLRVGFGNADSNRIRLKHQHSYGRQAKSKSSSDTYATGERIKLRVYTICGQQFVVVNGKHQTLRSIDNVWTSHQFVTQADTKLTLYKSTLRAWIAGDEELFRRTVSKTDWLRCVATPSNTVWDRKEFAKFIAESHKADRKPKSGKVFVNQSGLSMVPVSPGSFSHRDMTINLTNDFWVSKYEVTQLQWENVMGSNPASIQGNSNFPVDNISYKNAVTFCRRLNTENGKRGLPKGYAYRLLTEAEWEYVCRAGDKDPFSVPQDGFWHRLVSQPRYHVVGTSSPNAFGVFDMHGNVEEFTLDQYVEIPSDSKAVQTNPMNPPDEKDDHVSIRGGSWCMSLANCQSDRRKTGLMEPCPYRGLRVALAPVAN